MRKAIFASAILLALALSAAPGQAQDKTSSVYAIENAKIYTLAGAPIEKGTVVIRDGKIAAVGADVAVPADAQVIDANGLSVYPGMFDPLSHIGLEEVGAVSATVDISELGEFNPELVAGDAVNPASEHIPVTRAAGITHTLTAPGQGGFGFGGGGGGSVMPGQASLINLAGWTEDGMLVRRKGAMILIWPTVATRTFDFETFTVKSRPYKEVEEEYRKRMDTLSDWISRAKHYAQAVEKGSPANFERDLKLEALVPVVDGKMPVIVIAGRERDIRNAVKFCEDQKLKMILGGGTEAWKVKDLLKEKNIPVILAPTLRVPEEEDDPYDKSYTAPGELAAAGIPIAFASFDVAFSRRLPQQAGTAVAYGLPYEEALKAVTVNAAKMLSVDSELGTIEPGKMANIVVTNGDLLELSTEVRYLFIAGQLTSLENKHHELYEKYRKRPKPASVTK
ncbi:MAG: amidohydrolase family protein [Candidatus Acidiferrales bacterium]